MKAEAKFVDINEHSERLREMGVETEADVELWLDFYFNIEMVQGAIINTSGNISIFDKCGDVWVLKYEKKLWDIIKKHLE